MVHAAQQRLVVVKSKRWLSCLIARIAADSWTGWVIAWVVEAAAWTHALMPWGLHAMLHTLLAALLLLLLLSLQLREVMLMLQKLLL